MGVVQGALVLEPAELPDEQLGGGDAAGDVGKSDLDDLLQQNLNALENGVSLGTVLAGLPAEAAELTPLLQLAASVERHIRALVAS